MTAAMAPDVELDALSDAPLMRDTESSPSSRKRAPIVVGIAVVLLIAGSALYTGQTPKKGEHVGLVMPSNLKHLKLIDLMYNSTALNHTFKHMKASCAKQLESEIVKAMKCAEVDSKGKNLTCDKPPPCKKGKACVATGNLTVSMNGTNFTQPIPEDRSPCFHDSCDVKNIEKDMPDLFKAAMKSMTPPGMTAKVSVTVQCKEYDDEAE